MIDLRGMQFLESFPFQRLADVMAAEINYNHHDNRINNFSLECAPHLCRRDGPANQGFLWRG